MNLFVVSGGFAIPHLIKSFQEAGLLEFAEKAEVKSLIIDGCLFGDIIKPTKSRVEIIQMELENRFLQK